MKKIILMFLAAMTLFSCKEDEEIVKADDGQSVAVIRINVQGINLSGRAVEDEHSGATGTKVNPDIKTIHIIPYGSTNLVIGDPIQVDDLAGALYGNGTYMNNGVSTSLPGSKPAGAKVGLPKGTVKVGVILNKYDNLDNLKTFENINFYNYRNGIDKDGKPYANGSTTFARVPLVPVNGQPILLTNPNVNGSIPEYTVDFEVAPSFARIEVYGGIPMPLPEVWTDYFGNGWIKMTVTDFLNAVTAKMTQANISTLENLKSNTDNKGIISLVEDDNGSKFYYYGAMLSVSPESAVESSIVYLPKYFWANKDGISIGSPEAIMKNKINILPDGNVKEKDKLTTENEWIENILYEEVTAPDNDNRVYWNPYVYYAIDVEEIYMNNIKVLNANATPFMHQWPGSQKDTYWPSWYDAFHLHGWHTAGTSSNNTFLCMGNMWDRIADAEPGNYQDITLTGVAEVGGGADLTMPVIKGKAKPLNEASIYYDVQNSRNLGITLGKAAAYQIYPQSFASADKDALSNNLPHIIVKLKAYKTANDYQNGKYDENKQFITMKVFKSMDASDQVGGYITDYKMGWIYRLKLNDILKSLRGEAPVPNGANYDDGTGKPTEPNNPIDPDPEMPGVSLVMSVKVLPWTIQNMTPEL